MKDRASDAMSERPGQREDTGGVRGEDILASSYAIHNEWLGGEAGESVQKIISGISEHGTNLMNTAGEDDEQANAREVAAQARQWHNKELMSLLANIRASRTRWRFWR